MKQQKKEKCFYTCEEAAESLGVNVKTVRALIKSGKLKAFNTGSGKIRSHYRIGKKIVDKFLS